MPEPTGDGIQVTQPPMTYAKPPATDCETVAEAVERALYADNHGNGTGCTQPFVVRRDECNISVVRKTTFEQPAHFLFTVRVFGGVTKEQIIEQIETALGMDNTDVTVTLEEHDDRMTAIVPVGFRQVSP